MQATIVFQKNWEAINTINPDGSNRYRYIVNKGSSRSSKTISLIQVNDLYARKKRNKRLTIWRDTKTDCRKTVLVDFLKTLKRENLYKVNQEFNKTESIFTYSTESTVEIHGTDDEETVHGLTQDVAWFNEPYKISRDTFDQIDQRTSDFIFIDYNPKKDHWVNDLMKDERTLVIHSTFKDNPFCPVESRNKILSYQPLSRCYLVENNIITTDELRVYNFKENNLNIDKKHLIEAFRCIKNEGKNTANDFKWSVYGLGLKAEKPNRIYHWNKITRAEYDALDCHVMYAVDWGKVDPFSIVEMKLYDQTVYVRELNYLSENDIKANATPEELAQMFHNVGTHEDEQYNQDTGVVLWLFKKLGLKRNAWMICDNNRPLKRDACRRAGWEYIEDTIKIGMKVDGISMVQNVNICYTDDSPNIEYEHENYSWKVDRYGITLEVPEEKDDHHMDSIMYGILKLIREGLIRITV